MIPGRTPPTFDESVFINCPFDPEYAPLFRVMVFTVEWCRFRARCGLDIEDSGETRAEKLYRMIRESRLGIHDISRTEVTAEGLPRFNMPYEFGLFVGFKVSGVRQQARKVTLVLDRERHRYQKFLSDIAGQDIRTHGGKPGALIREVRNWLQAQTERQLPGAKFVAELYAKFTASAPKLLRTARMNVADLDNYHDFHRLACDWIDTAQSDDPA